MLGFGLETPAFTYTGVEPVVIATRFVSFAQVQRARTNGTAFSVTPVPSLVPPNAAQLQRFVQRVIDRINRYQAQFGCPALRKNTILMGTAQGHSEDMALHNFVGHQSSDGTSPWDRMYRAGYRVVIAAENVAWG